MAGLKCGLCCFMEHTDLELMDFMLKDLFHDIVPQKIERADFVDSGFDISDNQFLRVKRLVITAGVMEELEENRFMMTAKGLELMIKFGSYSGYLKDLGQEKKKDLLIWKMTIAVGIATILVALVNLLTFFLGL